MTTDYQKQATDFLTSHNLEFRAVLVGDDCPPFCEDYLKQNKMEEVSKFPRKSHIHGKHYRCTISSKDRGHITFDFWNSYADEEENHFAFGKVEGTWVTGRDNCYWDKYRIGRQYNAPPLLKARLIPTAYDLLACIEKNDPGDFEEFCSSFGCDTDSRRAEDTWRAVVKEWQKVKRFFTAEELAELQDIS